MDSVQVARFSYLNPHSAVTFASIGCDKNGIFISDGVDNIRIARSFRGRGDITPVVFGKRPPISLQSHIRSGAVQGTDHLLASRKKMFCGRLVHAEYRKKSAVYISLQFGGRDVGLLPV